MRRAHVRQALAALAGLAVCITLVLLHVPASAVLPFFCLSLAATLTLDAAISAGLNVAAIALCGILLRYAPQTPRPVAGTIILAVIAWYLGTMVFVWLLTQRLRRKVRNTTRRAENTLPQPGMSPVGTNHLYARLVDLAPDAVVCVDSAGYIVLWNQMAQKIFGYSRDEILGQSVEVLVPEHLRTAHAGHRAAFMLHPRTRPMGIGLDLQARHKDGSLFPCEIALAPIERGSGAGDGATSLLIKAVVHDTAQRLALEEQVRAAQVAQAVAEKSVQDRDLFLSIVAHELRTPMTAIAGLTERLTGLLLHAPTPLPISSRSQVEGALTFLSRQTGKMVRLLDATLDMARLNTDRFTLNKSQVDLFALLYDKITLLQAATDLHTLTLDFPKKSVFLWADPVRLEQVVGNLLDNALKYSPEGGTIVVSVRAAGGWVRLSVRDHGLGIPEDRRAELFGRFFQAHGANFRSGLGLGSYICKEIVEKHGGRIRAEFPDDGGTRVVILLPQSDAAKRAGLTDAAP